MLLIPQLSTSTVRNWQGYCDCAAGKAHAPYYVELFSFCFTRFLRLSSVPLQVLVMFGKLLAFLVPHLCIVSCSITTIDFCKGYNSIYMWVCASCFHFVYAQVPHNIRKAAQTNTAGFRPLNVSSHGSLQCNAQRQTKLCFPPANHL